MGYRLLEYLREAVTVLADVAWRMRPHDLRVLLPLAQGRKAAPSAVICDSRTLPSPLESGTRAGYDGAKRRRGSYLRRTNTRAHTMDNSSRGIDRYGSTNKACSSGERSADRATST